MAFKLQLPGEEHSQCSHAVQLSLPTLQHLELRWVQLVDVSSLEQLTKAPKLDTLILSRISFDKFNFDSDAPNQNTTEADVQQLADAIPRLLQQLPLLSVLQLGDLPITDAALQATAALPRLKQIDVEYVLQVPAFDLQYLSSNVTQLTLRSKLVPDHCFTLPQELPQLSGLLDLSVEYCTVPPKVLGSITQLHVLYMEYCTRLPDRLDGAEEGEGAAAFLDELSKLVRLQHLGLDTLEIEGVAPQHFSALTASSHLTHLYLRNEYDMPLPRAAVQHMFPAGRQMPALQYVSLSTEMAVSPDAGPDDWCVDSADLCSIICACPKLLQLQMKSVMQPGADLSVLLQLPESCTELHLGGAAFTDAAAPVVAQLTQLESLQWCWSPGLTDAGLEKLVALDLESLFIHRCSLSAEVSVWQTNDDSQGTIALRWSPENSVSQQLDALCDLSPVCAPARLTRHKAAAAAREQQLQQTITSLHARLCRSRAEVRQMKQQLAATAETACASDMA